MTCSVSYHSVVSVAVLSALSFGIPGFAQNQEQIQYQDEPLQGVVVVQPQSEQDEPLQGTGIIVRKLGDSILEEYRVSGRTRSVKVIPANGVPYYLIDADGDGELNTRSDIANDGVTGWRIMNW